MPLVLEGQGERTEKLRKADDSLWRDGRPRGSPATQVCNPLSSIDTLFCNITTSSTYTIYDGTLPFWPVSRFLASFLVVIDWSCISYRACMNVVVDVLDNGKPSGSPACGCCCRVVCQRLFRFKSSPQSTAVNVVNSSSSMCPGWQKWMTVPRLNTTTTSHAS